MKINRDVDSYLEDKINLLGQKEKRGLPTKKRFESLLMLQNFPDRFTAIYAHSNLVFIFKHNYFNIILNTIFNSSRWSCW